MARVEKRYFESSEKSKAKEKYPQKDLALLLTGAMGDTVIASALHFALNEKGYKTGFISSEQTLSLLDGLENCSTYKFGQQLPEEMQVVDVSDYLSLFPHSRKLPGLNRYGHLCEWMGVKVRRKTGLDLAVSRDRVRVVLTPREAIHGHDRIRQLSEENNGKPVVIIHTTATTKNRSLDPAAAEKIAFGLKAFSAPFLLEPLPDSFAQVKIERVRVSNLRELASLLWAADSYIGVDSGPLHIAAGALQGTSPELANRLGIRVNGRKIVLIVGSSRPEAVAYKDNQVVVATGGCYLSPCGVHGYHDIEKSKRYFGRRFVQSNKVGDKSGCIYPNYNILETSKCMTAVPYREVIEKVHAYLENK